MIRLRDNSIRSSERHHQGQTQMRVLLLVLAGFAVGMAAGAFLLYRSNHPGLKTGPAEGNDAPLLSENTRSVLQHLKAPVQIHFYSLLDPATVSGPVQAFAGRVGKLLSQYEAQAGGKLQVSNYIANPDPDLQKAAAAEGMKPFNLDKGDACYLGIAVVGKGQKESLAELSPEWEQAVEFDLTRAIGRVANPPAALPVVKRDDTATLETLKRSIPNLDSLSLAEGSQRVRETSLAEFREAAKEMQAKIQEAQQRLQQAQSSGSPADQQAATKQLQQLQAEQTQKLQEIAARSRAQIEALERLKAAGQ